MQLELFDSARLRLARARDALWELDLKTSTFELQEHLALYPADVAAQTLLAEATCIADRLAELEGRSGDRVEALLLLERDISDPLRSGWHRRLATEAERHWGNGCAVGGKPVGLHWQLGGDLENAERSFRVSLAHNPDDAQLRVYLANVLLAQGERDKARREYLRAFLRDPQTIDVATITDCGVAELFDVARLEYEVAGEPSDWVAAVGMVEGVFPLPTVTLPGVDALSVSVDSSGLAFCRCLLEERTARSLEDRVRVRATMKGLCPKLLTAYLQRFR